MHLTIGILFVSPHGKCVQIYIKRPSRIGSSVLRHINLYFVGRMTDKKVSEGRAIANVSIERVSHTTTLYCSHPDVKAGFRLESGSKVSLFRTDPILRMYRCYFIESHSHQMERSR